ncbi:MAG: SGNH/GDSL hydrolase family protein [Bacteroidales bacterium]|nr:SGNH/GDSL hydrolase family protein [Bacteroidales bacterium]MCF8389878.1 SGNH/GDSL hydrolase family protein [Bacteroidales bacterium]
MRKNCLFLLTAFLFSLLQPLYSQLDSVLIDFGAVAIASAQPWNNVPAYTVSEDVSPLCNGDNKITPYGIRITDRFTGVNESGTNTPAGVLGIPATASRDSYFGNIEIFSNLIEPTAAVRFSGLTPEKDYTFIMYASRMGVTDNRETKYKFEGSVTDSVYLNPSNNVSNFAEICTQGKPDGTLDIIISPGENNNNSNHFYYLGAIKIIYAAEEPLASEIKLNLPNGGEGWFVGSEHLINWTGINLSEEVMVLYSTDKGSTWSEIGTVPSTQKSISWIIPDVVSSECLIKVVSGTIDDASDGTFAILDIADPAIIIIQPNGGESWITGTTQMIKWTPNLLTEDISVKYTVDNGTSWTSLATVASDSSYISWTIPNEISSECRVAVQSGIYADTSYSTFSIVEPVCSNTIVVLGSSTAAGTGASPVDSAWVWRYSAALKAINPDYNVVNLGLGGYTTFQIVPTGTTFEPGITETIDQNRNVTKAMTYSPYAIIVNMPSNDAKKYTAAQTLANLKLVSNYAHERGVKAYIATTQPRNFTEQSQLDIQKFLSTEIINVYQEYGIDFWTGIANENNWILPALDSGDGVHLNNKGHKILFERVMEKHITNNACEPTSVNPPILGSSEVNVFPNPTNDEFTMMFTTESDAKVEIRFYDISGRELGSSTNNIDYAGSHNLVFSGKEISGKSSMIIAAITINDSRGVVESRRKIAISNR